MILAHFGARLGWEGMILVGSFPEIGCLHRGFLIGDGALRDSPNLLLNSEFLDFRHTNSHGGEGLRNRELDFLLVSGTYGLYALWCLLAELSCAQRFCT